MTPNLQHGHRRRFNAFDGIVLAGALVNLAVVLILVGYWLLTR